ncbi:hypothetical protein L1887_60162 [Cichorium endivia]|nr:hypothetical protein L1887_60162 [Cichorium endivia]
MLNFHTGLAGSLSAVFWKRRKWAGLQVQKKRGQRARRQSHAVSVNSQSAESTLPSFFHHHPRARGILTKFVSFHNLNSAISCSQDEKHFHRPDPKYLGAESAQRVRGQTLYCLFLADQHATLRALRTEPCRVPKTDSSLHSTFV